MLQIVFCQYQSLLVDQETKIITAKKKEIYPQKKPRTEKVTVEEAQEETAAIQETKEEVFHIS